MAITNLDALLSNFSPKNVTEAINRVKNVNYGVTAKMGLFKEVKTPFMEFSIDTREYTSGLIPFGSDAQSNASILNRDTRKLITLSTTKLELDTSFETADIIKMLSLGSNNQVDTVAGEIARRLELLRNRHEFTHEFMRVNAIKGVIKDTNGNVVWDYFSQFGKPQETVSFKTSASATDMLGRVNDAILSSADKLGALAGSGFALLAGKNVYSHLLTNKEIRDTFNSYQSRNDLNVTGVTGGFIFGGLTILPYPKTPNVTMIEDDLGYIVPIGSSIFSMYRSPALYNSTIANEAEYLSSIIQESSNKQGWIIRSMSCVNAVNLAPDAVLKVTIV